MAFGLNVRLKLVFVEAGEPMAMPESDVGGNKLVPKSVFHVAPEVERTPAFAPVPTVTVAIIDGAGQRGLAPWMGADFVPPGVPLGRDQMAEQTVSAAWAPLALVRVRAKRAAPERARCFTKNLQSLQIVHG